MPQGVYIGVNNLAQKMRGAYVGVDGIARRIKSVYVGDVNGVAQLCWSVAGLYDADGNLVASWDTLVNTYGLDIESNYPHTDPPREGTMHYVLTTNPSLSIGNHLVIPNTVTSIGSYAFCNCRSLTSIEIPDSVSSIGNGAFFNCRSLTSIEIPNGVTSIGDLVFCWCERLTSITIPNGVTSIGYGAFNNDRSLKSITIPDSVTSIGEFAFGMCINFTNVYYTGSEEEWNNIEIESSNNPLTNATITYNYIT